MTARVIIGWATADQILKAAPRQAIDLKMPHGALFTLLELVKHYRHTPVVGSFLMGHLPWRGHSQSPQYRFGGRMMRRCPELPQRWGWSHFARNAQLRHAF